MVFVKRTIYECTNCKKQYVDEPRSCFCEEKLEENSVVGPFKLLEKVNGDKWKVMCLMCDIIKVIHRSNIKRSQSCGCKPRHCSVITFTNKGVRYKCEKCNSHINSNYPILDWCCNVE